MSHLSNHDHAVEEFESQSTEFASRYEPIDDASGRRGSNDVPLCELPVSSEFALSSGQKAMWFMFQMDQAGSAYNIVDAVRVRGPIDSEAMRRSLQKLYDRHASLRTTVHEVHGEPRQRVHVGGSMPLEIIEAHGWTEEGWRRRLSEETHRPFNLTRGPLGRVVLLRLSATEAIFAFVLHHIIADVWSVVVCVGEFTALYEAEIRGSTVTLPEQSIEFSDFVRWQNELLASSRGAKLSDYWRNELSGELTPLDLPIDRPRPPIQTYRGDREFITIDAATTLALKELSKKHRATLFMTLMAAYQVWIYRHTNRPDVLVGTVVAGRSRPEFATVVGDFVNSVVIRGNFTGNPWFVDALQATRDKVLKAFDHQDYPFPHLVETFHPQRDPARTPIFQTMFVMQRAQVGNKNLSQFMTGQSSAMMSLGGATMAAIEIEQHDAQFDVIVYAAEAGDELNLQFQYNTDLFDATTMQRMVARFGELLKSIVADPARSVGRLNILPEAERDWLIEGLNDTERLVPQETISQLFERQAAVRPDAVLIETDVETVTFGEVNRRANRIAAYLRGLGVGVESLVGVSVERTPTMVAVLLGIFKLGAAYLPLDPTFPRERLGYML